MILTLNMWKTILQSKYYMCLKLKEKSGTFKCKGCKVPETIFTKLAECEFSLKVINKSVIQLVVRTPAQDIFYFECSGPAALILVHNCYHISVCLGDNVARDAASDRSSGQPWVYYHRRVC